MENINLAGLKISQFGYVYKDIEKTAKILEEKLDLPKFGIMELPEDTILYRSKESKVKYKMGFSRLGEIQIELIQLLSGECIYSEFLNDGKEGLHHVGIYVEELEPYAKRMKEKGFESIQSGIIASQAYDYYDTEDTLGFMLEIIKVKQKRTRKKPL